MTDERTWAEFLRAALVNDPDWVGYLATLSPRTPLNRAVEGYIRMVKSKIELTPEELKDAEEILVAMQDQGFDDTDRFLAALDRGEVNLNKRRITRNVRSRDRALEPGGA